MPVIFEKQIDAAKKLAVWHITESEEELFKKHHFLPHPDFSKKRNTEKAVSQILLNHLLDYDAHIDLNKDIFGKPYLNNSNIAISFSHSKQMVACIIALNDQPVGIDIEVIRPSIGHIAHKFFTKQDSVPLPANLGIHLVWGGKEVLYKIYAKKELDFIEHLTVKFDANLELNQPFGNGIGLIHKNNYNSTHQLGFYILKDFMLVWGS